MAEHLLPPLPGSRYSMLVSHVPFSKPAIAKVIPNATFITILRHPVAVYESIFGFFHVSRILRLRNTERQEPFEMFLSNPNLYLKRIKSPYFKTLLRNRQIFDVGLDPENNDNETLVDHVIQQATKDFGLVMIAEYFDESLILLKKLLCWEFEDILYMKQNTRNDKLRSELNDWKTQRILKINSADFKLYQHFNNTFWLKVREYGDSFDEDLATFRSMLRKMISECLDEGRYVIDYSHRRNRTLLKQNAPSYCIKIKNWGFKEIVERQRRRGRHT
uniref:Galactosylceramide sulfotransferase-like n=1 Tax=Saccoglossus kowalevskii TaxID=10224 RepID=A0ABM0MXJ6_SACKO|nr:PREDICTED: galactosylceramide sulfotransferase-like [Saccoglossus kowalevskii]